MKSGMIGAGNVGGGLARIRQPAGHDEPASSRAVIETSAHGDEVVLAGPGKGPRIVKAR
jgi:predicted dinucleotide-binding enzyme